MDALTEAGLLHPAPDSVTAAPFREHPQFFVAADKVQVKYEMLRAHLVAGESATTAARTHGYSRASFYVVARAFEAGGIVALLDERPGRRGPLKLSAEVLAFLSEHARAQQGVSGAQLARELQAELGIRLHRRTIERVLAGPGGRP
jgi:transposase